ncbi:MAG TPA: cupin domain-containing protein [Vicinamibacterales bacterium]|nr:cupin domain-containing protein [Vicinamibacterales bacterium]
MSGDVRRAQPGEMAWEEVPVLAYKQHGEAPFKDVTRQVLFDDPALAAQLRYFEVAPGGHTTLERHEHVHAVVIVRGRGRCLIGDAVHDVAERDLVRIASMTWHQFRAAPDEPLGFLCVVNAERDRPQLPDVQALTKLRATPAVADFIRV